MNKKKLIPRCQYGTNRGGLVNHDRITPGTWGNRGQGNELQSALERGLSAVGKGVRHVLNLPAYIEDGTNWLLGAIPGGFTSEEWVHDGRAKREAGSGGQWVDHRGNTHVNPMQGVLPDWLLPTPAGKAKAVMKYDDLLDMTPSVKKASDVANKTNKIKITAENAAKITDSQWDDAYNAAIANNDLAEAQRLRDLHFKAKAPNTKVVDSNGNPIKTYHGNMTGDSHYRSTGVNPYSTARSSLRSSGYFSSSSEKIADSYRFTPDAKIHQVYLNYEDPLIIDAKGAHYSTIGTDHVANKAFSQGSDGVIIKNVEDAGMGKISGPVVGEARIADDFISTAGRAKSSDAVTKRVDIFTGEDIIIPLSERDNFSNPDIRYSWLLPIGLTTAFGFSANQ